MHFLPTALLRAALFAVFALLLFLPLSSARATPLGELRTAVLLVNFSDDTSQPVTRAGMQAQVFGEVSDFYWESSYQKTYLSGDVFGWYTLPLSTTTCQASAIPREANAAAAAAGVDLSRYDQVIYQFPYVAACGWSGSNNRSAGGQRQVLVNGARTYKVIAHELGHTLGLLHSDALDCGTASIGSSCIQDGYADQADAMGNRGVHFNAFQKERLGWLNAPGVPSITTVVGSGRYTIETYNTPTAGVKALKILKGVDAATGQKTWYYVEYRQATGYDSLLKDAGNLAKGLLVRTGTINDAGFATSLLLDMTPASNSVSAYDVMDGALEVGRSFVDPAAGVTISLASADANGAVVDVSLAPVAATCTRSAPVVTLAGPTMSVPAGTTVTYTATVANRDSNCTATTFNLARSVPSGWTGTLASSTLTISAGASASTTLAVTSPSTAAGGSYGIGVGTGSIAGTAHTVSASAAYSISAAMGGSFTETVTTNKATYQRGETVALSARLLSDGAPVSGASVRFTLTLPGGSTKALSAITGSDGHARTSYRLGKAKSAAGAYQVRADASSGGASATASTGFSVL